MSNPQTTTQPQYSYGLPPPDKPLPVKPPSSKPMMFPEEENFGLICCNTDNVKNGPDSSGHDPRNLLKNSLSNVKLEAEELKEDLQDGVGNGFFNMLDGFNSKMHLTPVQQLELQSRQLQHRLEQAKQAEESRKAEHLKREHARKEHERREQEKEKKMEHKAIYPEQSKEPFNANVQSQIGLQYSSKPALVVSVKKAPAVDYERQTMFGDYFLNRFTLFFRCTLNAIINSPDGVVEKMDSEFDRRAFADYYLTSNGVKNPSEACFQYVVDSIHTIIKHGRVLETMNTFPVDLHVECDKIQKNEFVNGCMVDIFVPRSHEFRVNYIDLNKNTSEKWVNENIDQKIGHALYFTDLNCMTHLGNNPQESGDGSSYSRKMLVTPKHPIHRMFTSGFFFNVEKMNKLGFKSGSSTAWEPLSTNYEEAKRICEEHIRVLPVSKDVAFKLQTFSKEVTYSDLCHSNHVQVRESAFQNSIDMEMMRFSKAAVRMELLMKYTVRSSLLTEIKQLNLHDSRS